MNVTYTCHDSQVDFLSWSAHPYFFGNRAFFYGPGGATETRRITEYFYTEATSVDVDVENVTFVDVTTNLRVVTSGVQNRTNISCITYRGDESRLTSSVLYFAGNHNKVIVRCLLQNNYVHYRCNSPQKCLYYIPREGDIFPSCTRAI